MPVDEAVPCLGTSGGSRKVLVHKLWISRKALDHDFSSPHTLKHEVAVPQDLQSGKLARVLRTQAKLVAATTGGQQDVGGGSLLGAPTHRTVSAKVDAAGEAARSRR